MLTSTDTWRRQRKFAHQIMNETKKNAFYEYPLEEVKRFLPQLLANPDKYQYFLEQQTGRTISRIAWGSPQPSPDLKEDARGLLAAISPAGAISNVIPILMKVPEWLAPWKKTEKKRHDVERDFFFRSHDQAKKEHDENTAHPSFTKQFLDGQEKFGFSTHEGAYCIGMLAIAGALTMAAPMQSYLLAMCHYPQWQVSVQNEIDSVTGDRMPEMSDMPNLPILRAIVMEVLRWRPPVPTGELTTRSQSILTLLLSLEHFANEANAGIPHRLEKDDVYNLEGQDYFIPAGSTIHAMEWYVYLLFYSRHYTSKIGDLEVEAPHHQSRFG
jgi:cytochrome P450